MLLWSYSSKSLPPSFIMVRFKYVLGIACPFQATKGKNFIAKRKKKLAWIFMLDIEKLGRLKLPQQK